MLCSTDFYKATMGRLGSFGAFLHLLRVIVSNCLLRAIGFDRRILASLTRHRFLLPTAYRTRLGSFGVSYRLLPTAYRARLGSFGVSYRLLPTAYCLLPTAYRARLVRSALSNMRCRSSFSETTKD
jgi:hypothetical protein